MYRTVNIQISRSSELFEWCSHNARCANNLYNAALFRERQMMSSTRKSLHQLTDNELEVMSEVEFAKPAMSKPREVPKSGFMGYVFLDAVMKYSGNPDYNAVGFPRHCAQNTLKNVVQDITSYFEAAKDWKKHPGKYKGKPAMPRYRHKNGLSAFKSSNIECRIRKTKRGNFYCSLPKTKLRASLGKKISGKLMEVHVTPVNGIFQMSFVFDDGILVYPCKRHKRIAAVDPGIDNLMAVTNNCGLPNLLFNGKPLKSINHHYNRQISRIMSANTKGSTDKFVPTLHYQRVTLKRNNRVKDYMLKSAKILMQWCVENRIDTIVLGKNADWKQGADMGKRNNQNFVQIPHAKLYDIITYLAERYGIDVIEQEESYTSKASFLDRDEIPVYGKSDSQKFSGRRIHRGLYRASDGRTVNADLNGSANILRKCFPSAFSENPDFNQIIVIRHPDKSISQA